MLGGTSAYKAWLFYVLKTVLNELFRNCSVSFLVSIEDLFAFHYYPKEDELTKSAGWSLYEASTEFSRMEVPLELWNPTKLNREYKVREKF